MTLDRARNRRPAGRPGFTIVELLIVVAIIALLAGLVLGGLATVRARASATTTLSTMQAFQNAAEQFRQDHGYYPGLVPERLLAFDSDDTGLTGTQNAIIHLLGGYVVEGEVSQEDYDNFTGPTVLEYEFDPPPALGGTSFRFKVDLARLGEGPTIDGQAFERYLTLRERDLGPATRDGESVDELTLPDLLDAWGTPIVYLRRASDVGVLIEDPEATEPVQFLPRSMRGYLEATGLGELGRDQVGDIGGNVQGSILTGVTNLPLGASDEVPVSNLRRLIENPGVPGRARGAFMLLSAGPDGVFMSGVDGPGNADQPVFDIGDRPREVVEEYDDIVLFGGS